MKHSNQHLIQEFQNGSHLAFRKLFDCYWEAMFLKAKAMGVDEGNAKDIVQRIWIALWEKKDTVLIQNFEAYIFRALRNGCYNHFRANKKAFATKVGLEGLLEIGKEPEVNLDYALQDAKLVIENSMSQLPPRCKQILELRSVKNSSNEEIAKLLGISIRSVENQMSIALKYIRTSLAKAKIYHRHM